MFQKEMKENAADIRDVALQIIQMYLRDSKIQKEENKHKKIFQRVEDEIKIEVDSDKSTSLKMETKTKTSTSRKSENAKYIKRETHPKVEHSNESPRKQRRVE